MYFKKLILALSLATTAAVGTGLPSESVANTVCERWSSNLLICTTYDFDSATGLWTTRVTFHPIESSIDP